MRLAVDPDPVDWDDWASWLAEPEQDPGPPHGPEQDPVEDPEGDGP